MVAFTAVAAVVVSHSGAAIVYQLSPTTLYRPIRTGSLREANCYGRAAGTRGGIAVLGYVALFLLLRLRTVPATVLAGVGILSTAALVAAGGRPALRRLLGRESSSQEDAPGWWLARVEPAVEDAWNAYADLILTVGLWTITVGAFGRLVTDPGDDPPFGLVTVGFLSMVCGFISPGFLIDSRYE